MVNPSETLKQVHAAQQRLLERLRDLTDDVARQPSLLPGWSVANVLAHLARNADSVVRRLEGSARADPAELLGWLTGRGPAPILPAWR